MSRIRVLLVEDDDENRELLAELLQEDFDVTTAPDGETVLDAAQSRQPDVVVTDEALPGIRGTVLARVLKHRNPLTRIVLLSGYTAPLDTEACDRVLHKPVDIEALRQIILALPGESSWPARFRSSYSDRGAVYRASVVG